MKFRIILTVNFSMWSNYSGGGQRSTHNLAVALSQEGHEVHVINTKAAAEQIDVPKDLPYQQHFAIYPGRKDARTAPFRNMSPVAVKKKAAEILQKAPKIPQILHSNGEEGAKLHELRATFPIAIVSTVRYSHYPESLKKKRKSIGDRLSLRLKHYKYLLQQQTATHADAVCPPSEWAAKEVKTAFHLNNHVEAVCNGVPKEFLNYHRNHQKAVEAGDYLFFGRLSHDKGVDTLIQAYAELPEFYQRHLHIVGKGPLQPDLERMVQKLELEHKISFHGWENHDQIGKRLENTALCILPSLDENYSLALLGSLATGTTTISTTVGGSPEIIQDGHTGRLVPPSDARKLTHVIVEVMQHPELNIEMGTRGANFVRNERTWQHAAQHFLRIYQKIAVN